MRRSGKKEKQSMERYLNAGSSFVRRQYAPHLALTLLFCGMSGFFVSFRNLEADQAAKVMEMYVTFAGILLMTPLFMPEQNREIWLLEKSKAMPMWRLYLMRVVEAVICLALLVTVFIQLMKQGNSQFPMWDMWSGSFCEILFLGSIGFFISGVTNQVILGYMVSVVYFLANIGASKYLGKFALFQMMQGSYDFAWVMFITALVLIVGGILLREKMSR